MEKYIPERKGSLHPNIAPYGEMVKTKDNKDIVLAVGNNTQFRNLCFALGAISLADNKKFRDNIDRVKNRKKLKRKMDILFRKKNASEWINIFVDKNIPAGLCRTVNEVLKDNNAAKMLLSYRRNLKTLKCIKTIAFEI